jgi:hypothetical protein
MTRSETAGRRPTARGQDDLGREASRRRSDLALISLDEAMTAGLSSD